MSRFFKSAAFPIVVVIVLAFFAQQMLKGSSGSKPAHTWSEFVQYAKDGRVTYFKTDVAGANSIKYSIEADKSHTITIGIPSQTLLDEATAILNTSDPSALVDGTTTGGSPWWSIFVTILPFVLFFGLWIFLMNQMQGGGSKVMSFGKSR
ncbi:MAG: cell division protease FtsH, partial [Gaiellales bacterium]|nr:cell division protease FtsH [Gaiellales bacterium]